METRIFDIAIGVVPPSIQALELNDVEWRITQIVSLLNEWTTKREIVAYIMEAFSKLPILQEINLKKYHIEQYLRDLEAKGVLKKFYTSSYGLDPQYSADVFWGTKEVTPLFKAMTFEHSSFLYDSGLLARIGYLQENPDLIIQSFNLDVVYDMTFRIESEVIPFLVELDNYTYLKSFVDAMDPQVVEPMLCSIPFYLTHASYESWLHFLDQHADAVSEEVIHNTFSCLHFLMPLQELGLEMKRWYKHAEPFFFLDVLKGNKEKGEELGDKFVNQFQEQKGTKKKELPGIYGILYSMTKALTADHAKVLLGSTFVRNTVKLFPKSKFNDLKSHFHLLAKGLLLFSDWVVGKDASPQYQINKIFYDGQTLETTFFNGLLMHWIGSEPENTTLKGMSNSRLEFEMRSVGFKVDGESESSSNMRLEELRSELGDFHALGSLFQRTEDWENLLQLLTASIKTGTSGVAKKEQRLVWFIDPLREDYIKAFEQTKAKEKWSKGKERPLRALMKNRPSFTSAFDEKIFSHVHLDRYGCYVRNWNELLPDLVGHPHLYAWNPPHFPIEISVQDAQLELNKVSNGVRVSLNPSSSSTRVVKESETRYACIKWSKELLKVNSLLRQQEMEAMVIPHKGLSKAQNVLQALSDSIPVTGTYIEKKENHIASDNILVVQLTPIDAHLHVQLLIEIQEGKDIRVVPGIGSSVINHVDEEGKRINIQRDKMQELAMKKSLIESVSFFYELMDFKSDLFLEDNEEILDFLAELKSKAEHVKVIWPKGERLRIEKVVKYSDVRMQVKESNNWFEIGGGVTISDTLSLSMAELLEKSKGGKNNYVALDEQTFLVLEKDMKKRLADLEAVSQIKGGKVEVHPLGSNAVEGLLEQVPQSETDQAWISHLKKLDALREYTPSVPSNLKATLRPYQEEGFYWLDRLHNWGVGACLADDMGLGKTLQTIALLLKHGSNGPSLVIAPSSVCINWVSEIKRFAPTLNTIELKGQKREKILETLQPNDLLVASYGLIQSNPELLAQRKWNIVILDEAHAIKNSKSIRSQAVMKLNAQFRMITTGTPIQNHLGELWNLFQFINPGMLGSYGQFNRRYVQFENDGEQHKQRKALNKYIAPFILRRNKSEVLDDLPEKTEVVLHVNLSDEERALYETIRSQAVENISKSNEQIAGQQMQILAEITKLRQVSCNAALLDSDITIESSKLKALETLVDDLLESNHKALIFSQFTAHLSLIRAMLNKKGIAYQYLDGTISSAKRKAAVDNFQNGESSLFLISLKAGGVGLNLTAADYVIHMDPWWNPAIEDQASDRAHRIGQTRPVTIYRLITENTIEEKIVKLHHDKRNLADMLLAGTDQAGKISSEELFELIQS